MTRLDERFDEQIRYEIDKALKTAPTSPTVERIMAKVGSTFDPIFDPVRKPDPSGGRGSRVLVFAAVILIAFVGISVLQGWGTNETNTSLNPTQSASVPAADLNDQVLSNDALAEAERAQLLAVENFAPYVETVTWPHFGLGGVREVDWVLAAVEEVRPDGIKEWGVLEPLVESPAIVRSWYRTEGQTVAQLEVMGPSSQLSDVRLLEDGAGEESWIIDVGGLEVRRSDAGPWSMASWYSEQGELINLHVRSPANVEDHIANVWRLDDMQWNLQASELSGRITQQPAAQVADLGIVTATAHQGDIGAKSNIFSLRDICLMVDEQQVCAGNSALRDSGPYVRTPEGLLSYPDELEGLTTFSVVVGDVWWVGLYVEPVVGSEISIDGIQVAGQSLEAGGWIVLEDAFVVIPDMDGKEKAAQWMVVPVPPSAAVVWFETVTDPIEGRNAGEVFLRRWRPSS